MTKALLVLDFINDIADTKGKIAAASKFIAEHSVIENANRAIHFARQNKILCIFVKVGFQANYIDCPSESPLFKRAKELQALLLHTWGTEFIENLAIKQTDYQIVKPRVSAFYGTSLPAILSANQVKELLVCGVSTDMAVTNTVRDAHDRDFKVTILADACAASTVEIHSAALKLLERIATIKNSTDL